MAHSGSKRLISLAPDNWVKWITRQSNVQVKEFLSTEFQWVERANDVLLKAYSLEQGDFLILNEIQLRYKVNMPQGRIAYAALAEERYNLPVYPVLINILPSASAEVIPQCYQSEFMGIRAYQDYRVINLGEVEVELVFQQEISTLLPFVPILKGGASESVVREALLQLRTDEQLRDLEPLLSFFASFVLELPVVQQIMRWDMAVLRESPWYEQILKEGLEQGRQQGLQQGLQQGEASLIIRQLTRRFGSVDAAVQQRIRGLSVLQLEALGESLLEFSSLTDLLIWLEEQG